MDEAAQREEESPGIFEYKCSNTRSAKKETRIYMDTVEVSPQGISGKQWRTMQ
jgi:hypothetical protein